MKRILGFFSQCWTVIEYILGESEYKRIKRKHGQQRAIERRIESERGMLEG